MKTLDDEAFNELSGEPIMPKIKPFYKPSDRMRSRFEFARFCNQNTIDPLDAAELIELARRAFKAGERHANSGSDATHKTELRTGAKFEEKAKELGMVTTWPGFWPNVSKGGVDIYIPFE